MYTIYELSEKSNISIAVLQRYRRIGVLIDKTEKRQNRNNIVYSQEDLEKIKKYNFVEIDGTKIQIPKSISVYSIKRRCNKNKNKIETLIYWYKKTKNITEAIRLYDIVKKNKQYFIYRDSVLYSNKKRMDEICKLLLKYEKIENIPQHPNINSLWSKKLWMFYGFNEQEAEEKIKQIQTKNGKLFGKRKKENPSKYIGYNPTSLEYWLKKTKGNIEEAKKKHKENQTTFSKKKCIEIHGKEEGLRIWKERQDRWQDTMNSKPIEERIKINRAKMFKRSYSKISQELFKEIYERIKNDFNQKEIYFAIKHENGQVKDTGENKEYCVETDNGLKFLDFFIKTKKLWIEFDGDYWHGKLGNIERDKTRENDIKNKEVNVKLLRIKENEYLTNEKITIEKCLRFIYEKN